MLSQCKILLIGETEERGIAHSVLSALFVYKAKAALKKVYFKKTYSISNSLLVENQ